MEMKVITETQTEINETNKCKMEFWKERKRLLVEENGKNYKT